jgi:hypothetical protein
MEIFLLPAHRQMAVITLGARGEEVSFSFFGWWMQRVFQSRNQHEKTFPARRFH